MMHFIKLFRQRLRFHSVMKLVAMPCSQVTVKYKSVQERLLRSDSVVLTEICYRFEGLGPHSNCAGVPELLHAPLFYVPLDKRSSKSLKCKQYIIVICSAGSHWKLVL